MLSNVQDAWTDERIEATVTSHFVYSCLGEAAELTISDGVSPVQQTYAQRIVTKSKRLFLTLIDIGLPLQICRLIDEYYDDDYLPFAEDEVASLRLSQLGNTDLDQLFYRHQFKYLVRVLCEGEHIRYAEVEHVPVHVIDQKASLDSRDATDKVRLPSPVNQVYVRRHFDLRDQQAELDLLAEIAGAKSLSHEHVLSVYGSYTQGHKMFVLLSPTSKWNLKAFLHDLPKSFEALAKPRRRSLLLAWPHCLSNALAWLHANGAHHGAVRPSRIFIDEQYEISLGHFEGDWLLASTTQKGDLESYQYAAPEFWNRALVVQSQSSSNAGFNSGGRSATGRLPLHARSDEENRTNDEGATGTVRTASSSGGSIYAFVPAFKGNSSRLKLKIANRLSNDLSSTTRSDSRRNERRNSQSQNATRPSRSLSHRFYALSVHSSNSSEGNKKVESRGPRLMHSMPTNMKTTVIQSWKSKAQDLAAADLFSLAAISLDILTVLCSRSVSSFAKHRSTKNRQAGRGGGLADASFHANLPQVATWAEILLKDAEKKMKKKDGGQIFGTMEPILQSIIRCFDKDPNKRTRAEVLSSELRQHLSSIPGLQLSHCTVRVPERNKTSKVKTVQTTDERSQSLDKEYAFPEETASVHIEPQIPSHTNVHYPTKHHYIQQPITPPSTSGHSLTAYPTTPPANPPTSTLGENFYDDAISPDLFDYYESHWKDPNYFQPMPGTRIQETHRQHIESGEDYYVQPAIRASTTLGSAQYQSGKYVSRADSPVSPLREADLSPLPVTSNAVSTTTPRGSRRPISPYQANVTQATQMLAQTIGASGR